MRERWRTTGQESDQKRNNCSLAKCRFKAELRNELFDGLVVRLFGNFVARCLFFLWDALVFPFVSWIGWLMIRVFECVVSLIFFQVLYGSLFVRLHSFILILSSSSISLVERFSHSASEPPVDIPVRDSSVIRLRTKSDGVNASYSQGHFDLPSSIPPIVTENDFLTHDSWAKQRYQD